MQLAILAAVVLYILAGVLVATMFCEYYNRAFEDSASLENMIAAMLVWPLTYFLILILEPYPE